ncbi:MULTISPECIES: BtrH N-terminal domain-containing protein [unclassified Haladaptatus]|uniref:BtrH N-terminal domain-containing protein n=1 Tax=unclassified Haladaptatus TaxID=2622732 RepID=UPI00209C5007|nr:MULTISPECIES: BtrH N-terminal domain-containing protein [unclassified Haladaptatus]MCO8246772.1 BtrH N-terminal domain-containing protein [Haladaptatus sp. AB643]MCO8256420.1 BtrH N-terminal domain-containing protein [Haladaptatus sp. AB618]
MQLSEYTHTPGAHCGSASLRNLADYYDWGLNESLCFGYGAGLGFGYYERGPASHIIMGRNGQLETGFFETFDLDYRESSGQDWETAWADVRDAIADDTPVMLFVDLYYLDYFGTDTHFGPHILLCVGVEGDEVLLSDSEFDSIQRIPASHLRRAWNSDYGFGPLDNHWITVADPTIETDRTTAARNAIRRTTELMLSPEGGEWDSQGVDGIRAFAADLPSWTELEDSSWCARFAYQNIERRGTGGGAFRRLYADFLDALAPDLGLDESIPANCHGIADDWTELSNTLKDASETEGERQALLFEDASEQATRIADREERLFTRLRDEL